MFGFGTMGLFHLSDIDAIPLKMMFAPLIVGIICGFTSIFFTHFYRFVNKLMRSVLKKVSVKILFPIMFACISVVGYFMLDTLGSGHSLVDTLFNAEMAWYMLILIFLIRAISMMISNTSGVTGGVFLPTLAFGAILGSLSAEAMIALGWVGAEHRIILVVLGITAFLGSTSRIPITACVFAVEALGGINNILAIIIAATVAILVVEVSGVEDFTDTVIESKIHSITKGKNPTVIEVPLTVAKDAFVVGKELHDVLWPHSCAVISYERVCKSYSDHGISEGDIITVHYKTYHPDVTASELRALVGEQAENINSIMEPQAENI
jgi:H+/Cl- antiporter ClcA